MQQTRLNNYQNKFTLGIFKYFTIFNYRGIFLEIFRFWNVFSLLFQHKQIKYFLGNCLQPAFPKFFPTIATENLYNYTIFRNIANYYKAPAFLNLFNLDIFTNFNIPSFQQIAKKRKNITLPKKFFYKVNHDFKNMTFLLCAKKNRNIQTFSKKKRTALKNFALLPFFKKHYFFYSAFLDSDETLQNIPYKFLGNTKFLSTLYFFSQIFFKTQLNV